MVSQAETQSVQAIVVDHAISLLRPLTEAATDVAAQQRLLAAMGWDASALIGFNPSQLAAAVITCRTAIDNLAGRVEAGLDDLSDAVYCLTQIRAAVAAVTGAVEGWRPPTMPTGGGAAPPDIAADPYLLLLSDIFCHLLDAHLAIRGPKVRVALDLIGVRRVITPAGPVVINGRQARDARPRPFYDLGPLGDLLRDPVGTIRARVFGAQVRPEAADALADLLGPLLVGWLNEAGVLASYGTPGAASAESGLTEAERVAAAHLLHLTWAAESGPAAGAEAAARLQVAVGLTRDVPEGGTSGPLVAVVAPSGALEAHLRDGAWRVDTKLTGTTSPVIVGRGVARFEPPAAAGSLTGSVEVLLGDPDSGWPVLRFGTPGATRLEIGAIRFGAKATIDAKGLDGEVGVALVGARLLIEPGDDSFLAAVLPKQPIVVDLDLGLGWSPQSGLTLRGGAGLEQTFSIGRRLGPLTVHQVRVALRASDHGEVELRLTADLTVQLGPVTAAVTDVGLRAALAPAERPAALGPFDLNIDFLPPAGVGIDVQAAVVTGGGYLFADHATGEYAGAVQLKFAALQLSALGLLSTRMPDGSAGFSLLVLISVRFPPVQLGFGFSLTGVGGLIGVHRSVNLAALRRGLDGGALDSVLFPADLVANAPRIVRDLGQFFPTTVGQYVVGPTVELSWGAQGILTAQLGLFIEFPTPTRVVLAGRLRLALPPGATPPVVQIQVDLIGALDFSSKSLAIDGVLRDSRIASMALAGDLAVRANWGDDASFLLAVGGFNPRFRPPAGFPALRRLTLSISDRDNPRLRLSAYLALTSNTVQFGARLDLYASVSVPALGTFAIAAVVSFDALITLDPLGFAVDIHVAVALTWGGDPVLAVFLDASLTGPRPWHAVGTATFELFGKHSIHFDVTVGQRAVKAPPVLVDLASRVRAALEEPANWSADLPPSGAAMVTLAETATSGNILVHPLGSLTGRQKVAPLGLDIDRYGTARLTGVTPPFVVDRVTVDGEKLDTVSPVTDQFAQGEYLDLTEAERLSWPSFAAWTSGVRIDDSALTMPPSAARTVTATYDQKRVDADGTVTTIAAAPIPQERIRMHAAAGAAAVNGTPAQGENTFAGPRRPVTVAPPRFAVVRVAPPASGVIASLDPEQILIDSFAAARELLRLTANQSPAGATNLQLVDNDEVPMG